MSQIPLLRKEILELIKNPYSLWLLVVIPVTLVILSGQLNRELLTFWIYVEENNTGQGLETNKMKEVLSLFDNVKILETPIPANSVREFFSKNHLDIYYKYDQGWVPISQQISGTKKNQSYFLTAQIGYFIEKYEKEEKLLNPSLISQVGGVVELFPSISEEDLSLVPAMVVIISTFLAFLLSISGFYRERENNMLYILLSHSDMRLISIYLFKGFFAVFISLLAALLLILSTHFYYGFNIKGHFLDVFLLLLVTNFSSSLLGLIFSLICKSNSQIVYSTGIYLICLIVFSGIAYPLDGSSDLVIILSKLFPLTFSYAPFRSWLEHGTSSFLFAFEWFQALLQVGIYFVLAFGMLKWFEKRI